MDSGSGLDRFLGGPALPKGQNTKYSKTQTEPGKETNRIVLIRPMADMGFFFLWGLWRTTGICHPANFVALLRLIQKILRLTQGS